MTFYIQTMPLSPLLCTQMSGVRVSNNGQIRLLGRANSGLIDTQTFDATLLAQYQGFEVCPSERGVSICLLDGSGVPWIYNGSTWIQTTGWNTPEQIRAGLPQWSRPLRFRLRLQRVNRETPLVSELKFGVASISGNPISYLLNFGFARFLGAEQIRLSRWVDGPEDSLEGLNLELASDPQVQQFGDKYLKSVRYDVPIIPVGNETFYQIEQIPCVLLQLEGTENHRETSEVDSVRISPTEARLTAINRCFDQTISFTVVGLNTADVEAIAGAIIAAIDQTGCIEVPPLGLKFGARYCGDMDWNRSSAPGSNTESGQYQSASFSVILLAVPGVPRVNTVPLITGIDSPFMAPSARY